MEKMFLDDQILNIHNISLYEEINKKVYILPKHFVLGFDFLAEFNYFNVTLTTSNDWG